ncbi:MAG: EAL domain-containing protein [Bdellovibrionota bacterium]
MNQYIKEGVNIAIDDVGAGYSSLEAIVEIEPAFVKIDASIIRGIHQSKVKQDILQTLAALTKSVKAKTVAEGIETKEDLGSGQKLWNRLRPRILLRATWPAIPTPQQSR